MKTKKRLIIILLIALLIINTSYAETYTAFTNIVGIDNKGGGIVGNVTVEVQSGKGRILVDTTPLQGIYTQHSERTAVQVAEEITGFDFSDYDVIYSIITPDAHVVDGPSAGGALALVTIAAIEGKDISSAFAMTGTIQEDGSIGPIGEVLVKAKAASDFGVTVFLIPEGQATQNQYVRKVKAPSPGWYIETIEPVPVDVIEYAKENWGLAVYEVSDIKEVLKYAFGEIPNPSKKEIKSLELNMSLPRFSSPIQKYNDFFSLIKDKISRANDAYRKTDRKLKSSDLPVDVERDLNLIMENSKEYLDEANEIKEKGYAYSAGNDAFKSLINSNTVDGLIDYYSKPEIERFEYLQKELSRITEHVIQTKQEITSKTNKAICDRDSFEWAVAARQRMTYAENKIDSIQMIEDDLGIFYDINTAKEWIEISRNFASKIDSKGNATCIHEFKEQAEKLVEEADNEVSIAKSLGLDVEDCEWYLQAAKKEFFEGWYITAIYDAISAKTRASVAPKHEGKSVNELYEVFNKEDFTTQDLIGTIFLEHSHFVLYESVKDNSDKEALQAIQLLMLSKETNDNYVQIKKELVKTPFSWSFDFDFSMNDYALILAILVVGMGLYAMSLRSRIKKLEERHRMKSKRMRLKKVQEEIRVSIEQELKNRLKKKEITKKEYEELRKKFLK